MLTAIALLFLSAPGDSIQINPGAMSSTWFADVKHSASHDVPANGRKNGTAFLQTGTVLLDVWVMKYFAVGGAGTIGFSYSGVVPIFRLAELRLSTRASLTERLFLVGVGSVGIADMKDYGLSAPTLGADVGLGIRIGKHVSLRTDVGVFRTTFKNTEMEVTNDSQLADVERRLRLSAVRITAGLAFEL